MPKVCIKCKGQGWFNGILQDIMCMKCYGTGFERK